MSGRERRRPKQGRQRELSRVGGIFACNAILAALYARERTGAGERIDMALFDSTIAWLANVGNKSLSVLYALLMFGKIFRSGILD